MTEAEQIARSLTEARRFFIDCEFDGHDGPLLSIGIIAEHGISGHFQTTEVPRDPWVIENVMPIMDKHDADVSGIHPLNTIGECLRFVIGDCRHPSIIADSPVDIGRFCRALSTGLNGEWVSAEYPKMTFEVHNVNCYPTSLPGAVQHNAWWDALALAAAITRSLDND